LYTFKNKIALPEQETPHTKQIFFDFVGVKIGKFI